MNTQIGIEDKYRQEVVNSLSEMLADEVVLYPKTKNAYWNIEGADFHEKHLFFEIQSHQLEAIIDGVAERIRSLGHYGTATLKSFLALTQLTEMTRETNDSHGFIQELLIDYDAIVIEIRKKIEAFNTNLKDASTSDFVTSLMAEHEKMAWMLRSHLK
jgi:starvation-inducible DNA-binding protein